MKKFTLLLILNLSFLLFNSQKAKAQNVNIPDSNFKIALLYHLPVINTNGDNEIQVSEASTFTGNINVSGLGIINMTGIEAFIFLYGLDCSFNQLTSLNLSANTSLTTLNCSYNQLSSLNLLANTALAGLACSVNQLTSLNLSANTALTTLSCNYNQLTSLDVTNNAALILLYCSDNQLTSLVVSQNSFCCLNDFLCSNNQLTNIPAVPNQMSSYNIQNNNISCLINLPSVFYIPFSSISNNPLTCVPNQTSYSLGLPLCTDNDPINNPNNCQNVVNIMTNVL